MSDNNKGLTRRGFLAGAAAAGAGALLDPRNSGAAITRLAKNDAAMQVPTRPFGKTGVNVSTLSMGGMYDIPSNQLMLRQALRWGVTYWDTAHSYGGGRSEEGIGKYFDKYPEARKDVFLVTKGRGWSPGDLARSLDESLDRLKTDYVDLFFIHGISSPGDMDREVKSFADKAKAAGKIRFIGFSTHRNMAECLLGAPALGFVDGVMFTYNFRLVHEDDMRRAVDSCHEAGIGLTAMKTQGGGPVRANSERELELAGKFLERGFTDKQARLKAVWEDRRIAAICSQMPNLTIMAANVAAAMDRTSLSSAEKELFRRYAEETAHAYCAGCASVCEGAVPGSPPVADVMRHLMYHSEYGDPDRARQEFADLPEAARRLLANSDYTEAQRRCPRNLPIAQLVRRAFDILG
ncbi:MAG: aldo/keto reductase [Desulfatibacillaceae bacterium]